MKRSPLALSLLLIVAGAAAMWGSSRLVWLTATLDVEQLGAQTRSITGGTWSPESTAIALGLLAAGAALLFTRGLLARIVAVVALLLALLGGISGALALGGGVDTNRVHSVVTATDGVARTSGTSQDEGTVPQWAVVGEVQAKPAGPALALGGAVLALVGAAFAVILPRPAAPRADRYRTPAELRREAERAGAEGGLATGGSETAPEVGSKDPDQASSTTDEAARTGESGDGRDDTRAGSRKSAGAGPEEELSTQDADRLLWDSLDAGEDPTEGPTGEGRD